MLCLAALTYHFHTVSMDVTELVVPPNQRAAGSNQLKEFISCKQVIHIPLSSGLSVKELNFSTEGRIKKTNRAKHS